MKNFIWKILLSLIISIILFPILLSADSKPILIGCPVSMGIFYGPNCRDAEQLAIEEINKAGGVKVGNEMRKFKLIIADTRAMEPGVPITDALLAIEKLITQDKVDFLVGGPVRSEASFAARDLVTKYKKVWIVTVGTYSPHFGDAKKYPYAFRITGNVVWEIPHMELGILKYIRKLYGFNRIYIMVQDVKHAKAAGGFVKKLAKKAGFEIVGFDVYPTGATDFSMGLLKAKRKKAQILFLWFDMPEFVNLAKQYYEMKIPALPVGYMGPAEHLQWWKATEGKGEYFIVDLLNAGNAPSNATPLTMKFVKAYEKKYGQEPDAYGISTCYMGPYVLKDAIERAGSLDPDAVAKALEKTDMMGVYGRIRFDKNHEIIQSMDPNEGAVGTMIQWQNGKRITVYPESIKIGDIKLPKWMK